MTSACLTPPTPHASFRDGEDHPSSASGKDAVLLRRRHELIHVDSEVGEGSSGGINFVLLEGGRPSEDPSLLDVAQTEEGLAGVDRGVALIVGVQHVVVSYDGYCKEGRNFRCVCYAVSLCNECRLRLTVLFPLAC